jgi:hypothetical protein
MDIDVIRVGQEAASCSWPSRGWRCRSAWASPVRHVLHLPAPGVAERAPEFLGVALSVTAFPAVLARMLAEIKLLGTDLSRIAMSAAIVNVRHVRTDPVLATSISVVALRESGPLPRAEPTRHKAVCSRHSLCQL